MKIEYILAETAPLVGNRLKDHLFTHPRGARYSEITMQKHQACVAKRLQAGGGWFDGLTLFPRGKSTEILKQVGPAIRPQFILAAAAALDIATPLLLRFPEMAGDFGPASRKRNQIRSSLVVSGVERIGAIAKQFADKLQITAGSRPGKRSPPVVIRQIDVCAALQQRPHPLAVLRPHGRYQVALRHRSFIIPDHTGCQRPLFYRGSISSSAGVIVPNSLAAVLKTTC